MMKHIAGGRHDSKQGDEPRECLRCQNPFKSSGSGNRICDRCNKINTSVARMGYGSQAKPWGNRKGNDNR